MTGDDGGGCCGFQQPESQVDPAQESSSRTPMATQSHGHTASNVLPQTGLFHFFQLEPASVWQETRWGNENMINCFLLVNGRRTHFKNKVYMVKNINKS